MYAAMNYRSNLEAPDLREYFKYRHERVEPNSQGHTVISDFADKPEDDPVFGVHKRCWFWTLDEAAILYNCAKQFGGQGSVAVDIGSHTGWTSGHLAQSMLSAVFCVDPMYSNSEFSFRRYCNLGQIVGAYYPRAVTASQFFRIGHGPFDVVVIDGNHDAPFPLEDAQNSAKHLKERGIILLHDYRGEPIKEAYRWLLAHGFQGKTYTTPNGAAVCWRGEFTPPDHIHDPKLAKCE